MGQLDDRRVLIFILALSGSVLQYGGMISIGLSDGSGSSNVQYNDLNATSRNSDHINKTPPLSTFLQDVDITVHITIVNNRSNKVSPQLTPMQYLNIIASHLSKYATERTEHTNYYDDNSRNKNTIVKRSYGYLPITYLNIRNPNMSITSHVTPTRLSDSLTGNRTRDWLSNFQNIRRFCPIYGSLTCEVMFSPSKNCMPNTTLSYIAKFLHSEFELFNQSSNSTWHPENLRLTLCKMDGNSFLFSPDTKEGNGTRTDPINSLQFKKYIVWSMAQRPTFKIGFCGNGSKTTDDYCYSFKTVRHERLCGIFQMCHLSHSHTRNGSVCDRRHPQHPIKLSILGLKKGNALNCALALYQVNQQRSSHTVTISCKNITDVLIPKDVESMECSKENDGYNCSVWLEIGSLNETYIRGVENINKTQNNMSLSLSNSTMLPWNAATTRPLIGNWSIQVGPQTTALSTTPMTTQAGITPIQTTRYITPSVSESATTGVVQNTATPVSTAVEQTTSPTSNNSAPAIDVFSIMTNATTIPQLCKLDTPPFSPICEIIFSPQTNGSRRRALQDISLRLLSDLGDFNRSMSNSWHVQSMHLRLCKISNYSFLFQSAITSHPGYQTAMLKFNEYLVMLLLRSRSFCVNVCRESSMSLNATGAYCYSMDSYGSGGGICGPFQKCINKINNSALICDRKHAHHPIRLTLIYLSGMAGDCMLTLHDVNLERSPEGVSLRCSSVVRVINPLVVRKLVCRQNGHGYNCSMWLEPGTLSITLSRSAWFTDKSNETAASTPNVTTGTNLTTEPSKSVTQPTRALINITVPHPNTSMQFYPTNATATYMVRVTLETSSSPVSVEHTTSMNSETTSSIIENGNSLTTPFLNNTPSIIINTTPNSTDATEFTKTPTDEPLNTGAHQSGTSRVVERSSGTSSTMTDPGITFPALVVPSSSPINDWSRRPVNQSKIGDLLIDVPLDLKISIPPQVFESAILREKVKIENIVLSLLNESLADLGHLGLMNITITKIGYGASIIKYNLTMLALSIVEYSSTMRVAIPALLGRFPSLAIPSERETFPITHDIRQFNRSFDDSVYRAKHLINESCVLHKACPEGFGCQFGLMCVHICFNFTCGGSGTCVLNNRFGPECRCSESSDAVYSGERCEKQTFKYLLEPWKISVISSAVTTCVIAPILLAVFYVFSRRRNGKVDVITSDAAVSEAGGSVQSRVNSIDDILMDNDDSRYEAPPMVTVPIFEVNGDSASYLSCGYYRSDTYRAGDSSCYSYIGESRPRLGAYGYQPDTRRQFSLHREPSPPEGNMYLEPAVRRENTFIRELMRDIPSSDGEASAERSHDDAAVDDIYTSIRR